MLCNLEKSTFCKITNKYLRKRWVFKDCSRDISKNLNDQETLLSWNKETCLKMSPTG